ncbi:TRM8, partial [Symbiodinium sp. KB8]
MADSSATAAADAGAKRQKRPRLAKLADGLQAAGVERLPQKKYFRQRAHSNPYNAGILDDIAPRFPGDMDWARLYPAYASPQGEGGLTKAVEVADVGCGFGGLLFGLAAEPSTKQLLSVGMEIRLKVSEYVRVRIQNTRVTEDTHHEVSVVRSNAMRYFAHYFAKGQLSKVFTCFPDPHFKRAKHDRRIVSQALLAEYAFCIRPGGRLYTITDVYDLHVWMRVHGQHHCAFRMLSPEEVEADPCTRVMRESTEEGMKVEREDRMKYVAIFERLPDDAVRAQFHAATLWDAPDPPALYDAEM